MGTPGTKKPDDPILLADKVIAKIAKIHHKTPAQILLNWAIQRGTIAIPKSTKKEHIKNNIEIFDFELTAQEIDQINVLNKNHRFVNPGPWWRIPYFT